MTSQTDNAKAPAHIAHRAADIVLEKKGVDLLVLDLEDCSDIASYMVIASGVNKRQVVAIAEAIVMEMKGEGHLPLGVSGRELGWWVLIDYGDVLVHVMQPDARRYYDLEALWADAPVIRRIDGTEE